MRSFTCECDGVPSKFASDAIVDGSVARAAVVVMPGRLALVLGKLNQTIH